MTPYELFNRTTRALFYNLKAKPIQHTLDFDFLSKRDNPSIAAIVHPGRQGFHKAFFGSNEILIPIYPTILDAIEKHSDVDVMINFSSFRSAFESSKQALENDSIKTIVIVAEGMPERQSKTLIAIAKRNHKTIIGPATVGGIVAGQFRIGYAGGMNENIIRAKLYQPGSVGLVSRSGGMMNEFFNILSRATDGIYEGVAIGGDMFPGTTLLDHMLRYEENPKIKMIVALGEIGGSMEYQIIKAKNEGKLTKPIVMWVSGTCANIFSWEVQFGHAGAKAGKENESAHSKNKALKEAGIIIPNSFEKFEEKIAESFKLHVRIGSTSDVREEPPEIPKRKITHITSTISDDRGEETYNGITMKKLVEQDSSIGNVIALLWFKKKLPTYFVKFIELSIMLMADHGPAVAGAHNAIVTARAGKDVISSLISGLATIGPRFGGALDSAVRCFKEAIDKNTDPAKFVQDMKRKNILIPGIGHRTKSVSNPDTRVQILKEFAREKFPSTNYLEYALRVEEITLKKADNLILNVDGCTAALFLDAIICSKMFTEEEINKIVDIGYLNGLFALSRSIGIIGHILDQQRLGERLYRHDPDDILYYK
jgi:ATP citrate (pro-S)-lyase